MSDAGEVLPLVRVGDDELVHIAPADAEDVIDRVDLILREIRTDRDAGIPGINRKGGDGKTRDQHECQKERQCAFFQIHNGILLSG